MARILLSLMIGPLLLAGGCGGGGGDAYPHYDNPGKPASVSLAPDDTGDGWVASTPAAEGLNTQQLTGIYDSLRNGVFPGVDSMLVVRNQRLVAEGYFNGFDRDTVHELRSSGKSFISTLAGIALDEGLIDLDDLLSQHIPDFEGYRNMDANKRAITLRHLLNMSSGLDCSDWDERSPGHEEKMYDSNDWIRFMLDLRMVAPPGTRASYCTGGVVLLARAVALRSGMRLDDYAQQRLLGPLGIQQSVWRHSPDGRATGATGFGLRPRDAAKLGALFAGQGLWNGVRVVSESWVSTSRQRATALRGQGYGYLWWKRTYEHAAQQLETIFAAGNGGNFIFYVPSHELVVTFTGSNYNTDRSDTPLQIMPLVVSALP
jgi:CubicO group peptidase (beta-lactamase class C family)